MLYSGGATIPGIHGRTIEPIRAHFCKIIGTLPWITVDYVNLRLFSVQVLPKFVSTTPQIANRIGDIPAFL